MAVLALELSMFLESPPTDILSKSTKKGKI